jgi:hypothetical protein
VREATGFSEATLAVVTEIIADTATTFAAFSLFVSLGAVPREVIAAAREASFAGPFCLDLIFTLRAIASKMVACTIKATNDHLHDCTHSVGRDNLLFLVLRSSQPKMLIYVKRRS